MEQNKIVFLYKMEQVVGIESALLGWKATPYSYRSQFGPRPTHIHKKVYLGGF